MFCLQADVYNLPDWEIWGYFIVGVRDAKLIEIIYLEDLIRLLGPTAI